MATFNTKFNLNGTAYFVDKQSLQILHGTVIGIHIKAQTASTVQVIYELRLNTALAKTRYEESELLFIEEAKLELLNLLSARTSEIESLH